MSISKDFEKRQATAEEWNEIDPTWHLYGSNEVCLLLTHTRALEAMLKKHEWGKYDAELGMRSCPECYEYTDDGHAPDCPLAKLLEG